MFICPWCGTNYLAFQTNCSNCGGPLLAADARATASAQDQDLPMPPPAPRPISPRYVWRLLWSEAWWIVAFIVGLLGLIFTLVGATLTLGVVTAFVGVPFLIIGQPMLAAGGLAMVWRYERAKKVVTVLREGTATQGTVAEVHEQSSVSVNGRHPWVIKYQFKADGQSYAGQVTTLNQPSPQIGVGRPARILYLPGAPQWNSIYPHP